MPDPAAPPPSCPIASPAVPPVLRTQGLAYRYARATVWEGVSLELGSGEIALLTGPNGSGKSTLLRCLAGWVRPSAGAVEICGKPLDGTNRNQRRDVAFVPDVPAFYDDLTAEEHLRLMLAANRKSACNAEAHELLDAFGLAPFAQQLPSTYSRGMRQKLALALAFLMHPRLLLLDEPHGPLDHEAARMLERLCAQACDEGAAVVISCHHELLSLKPDAAWHLEGKALRASRPC